MRAQGEGGDQIDRNPLQDISNIQNNPPKSTLIRTWKKIACEVNLHQKNANNPISLDRRPLLELDEP